MTLPILGGRGGWGEWGCDCVCEKQGRMMFLSEKTYPESILVTTMVTNEYRSGLCLRGLNVINRVFPLTNRETLIDRYLYKGQVD